MSLDDYGSAAGDAGSAGNGPGAAGAVAAPATASSPAAQVQHKVDIAAMLQSLSADHRQVIVLRELKQLSYEEIADTLGIPRGTVESRLHRARQELKQRFADYLQ